MACKYCGFHIGLFDWDDEKQCHICLQCGSLNR